jgi:hypothetical protein
VPAAALFLERARALRPDLDLRPEIVVDICRRVSGLPLALELVSARVGHLPLTALRDRLAANLDDLTYSRRDSSERHRSMEQTLTWSTESLNADETHVLRVAALFPGGLRLDAAQAMSESGLDIIAVISALVDKSLLFLDRSSEDYAVPRWRMLDVVRQFVQARSGPGIQPRLRTPSCSSTFGCSPSWRVRWAERSGTAYWPQRMPTLRWRSAGRQRTRTPRHCSGCAAACGSSGRREGS